MLNNPRTLIVLYLMLAPLTALSQEQKIFNPKGWEIEQQIMKDRQVKLLEHIKNPVGLQLAKPDPDIADWEIDWKAQQQFCRAVADVIFKTPEKIEFAKPDFSFSRDDTSLYIEMNKKAYPKCKSYEYSKTEENIYKKRQLEALNVNKNDRFDNFYYDENIIISMHIIKNEVSYWYESGAGRNNCLLWYGEVTEDRSNPYPFSENNKVTLAKIMGDYVFLEYGIYQNEEYRDYKKAFWDVYWKNWRGYGGKKYVLATGVNKNLYYTLAKNKEEAIDARYKTRKGDSVAPSNQTCIFSFE